MSLNEKDFFVESWSWSLGSLKKQVTSKCPEYKQLMDAIQATAILSPFVEAITLSEDNSHFIVSFKDPKGSNDKKILQNFASIDQHCKNGAISAPEYFIDLVERNNMTLVMLLGSDDERYNYREYAGVQSVHFTEGNGLDMEVNADYQIAFTPSDFRDVFVEAPDQDIFRVGAIEIGNDQRYVSPIDQSMRAAKATQKFKGQTQLKTTIRNAMRKSRNKR